MIGATSRRDARGRPSAVAGGALLALLIAIGPLVPTAAAADPTPSPTPTATPAPTLSPPPFRLSLSRPGDFTRQYTAYQCVGASLQTMRNMIWSYNNRSPILQRRLWRIARAHSRYKADGGADPFGWTTATLLAGQGRYMLVAEPTLSQAAKAVARGTRPRGRPAGIVVWHGTHAWVITASRPRPIPRRPTRLDPHAQAVGPAVALLPRPQAERLPTRNPSHHELDRPQLDPLSRRPARSSPRGPLCGHRPIPDGAPLPAGAWTPTSTRPPRPRRHQPRAARPTRPQARPRPADDRPSAHGQPGRLGRDGRLGRTDPVPQRGTLDPARPSG